ncbi:cation transporting ATPase C-terminal domain-containing protein [Thermococcus sp. 5-4]|uniref:cation transporting ATPase C-terminal domain-containing protein n=1 Tax=Thermococcus sp. 5-4 TaxID=2008440 RepID=UPI000B49F14C|nr:cation transporting ATPase C-terminal domain-containing protein [Thermococcus sp. 5-4]ASA77061.1 hypothetical protein CDI07_01690 [Thermococcus sp. 5-4]
MERKTKVALILSLVSPIFAEVLSGSTPPLEVLTNPLSFPFLWAYYGAGVLLVREAWVRWGRNYVRLMLLGFVYGIVEEGLVIKSWFNPEWPDLDVFSVYGRVWGVNAVWAVWLTIFHSLMSIAIPIMVVDALYPEFSNERLLGRKGITIALVSFGVSAVAFFLFLAPYRPPALQYFLTIVLTALLLLLSRRVKREAIFKRGIPKGHPFVYGFGVSFALFFIFTAFPHSSVHPVVPSILGLLVALHFYSTPARLDERGKYALAIGFLAFWFVPYDIILELNGARGEALLGVATFAVLAWKLRKMGVSEPKV